MLEDQLITQFGEINRVEITEDELECFESESDYVGKCLDMMIEAGSFITVCTQLYPSGADGWTRDEAIIGGLLVRIYKLIHVILDQTCQNRLEPAFAQSRLLFETVVNLYFLTEEHNPEAFRDFVGYSLRHEQRLIEKIRRNIHDRNGQVLPIEQRMVSSIERAFERAEMSEAEVKKLEEGSMVKSKPGPFAICVGGW